MSIQSDYSGDSWQLPAMFSISSQRPSPVEAREVFFGLGENTWMQMIDGKFHQYGPMVFDEGLHKGRAEPGFLASLEAGCQLASQSIGEPLTVDFYKDLHKTLCAHFKGRANATEMTSEKTGVFRTLGCGFKKSIFANSEEEVRYEAEVMQSMRQYNF